MDLSIETGIQPSEFLAEPDLIRAALAVIQLRNEAAGRERAMERARSQTGRR